MKPPNYLVSKVPGIAATFSVCLGISVLTGWQFDLPSLSTFNSMYVAMAYNSALCFFVLGISLFALDRSWHQIARLAAVLPATIGLLTVIEHALGYQLFGMDTAFLTPQVAGTKLLGSRMAPNSAVCFAVLGFTLLTSSPWRTATRAAILGISGAFTTSFGITALYGYLFGVATAYAWRQDISTMAVHTAIGITVLGCGLLVSGVRRGVPGQHTYRKWLPTAIGVATLTSTVLIWQALLAGQRAEQVTVMPHAILALGVMLAFFSTATTHYACVSQMRVGELGRVNSQLLNEIGLREKIEADLRISQETLEAKVLARTAELTESEQRKAAILNTVLDCVLLIDDSGIIREFNTTAEHTFGYTPEEFQGRKVQDLFPERLRHSQLLLWAASGTGLISRIESIALRADGSEFPVEIAFTPMSADGQSMIVGCLRDITARKQAEEELQELNSRFRATFQQAAVGIAHLDLHGAWLSVNDKLCEITGYTREELLTRTDVDITHPDDRNWAEEHLTSLLLGDVTTYAVEKRYVRKDGTPVWTTVTVSLISDDRGQPEYRINVVEDITLRKKAELELTRSADRYLFLADAMPQIVWTAKPDGRYDYYNKRWSDYAGSRSPSSTHVIHPADRETAMQQWRHALQTGENYEVEVRLLRHDGEYRWHLVKGVPRRDDLGKIVQWVGSSTDISEQKRTETELEQRVADRTAELITQTQKAQEANKAKSEFLAMMSHEIRSPLNAIIGMGELLADTELTSTQAEYVRIFQRAGETLLSVINDILDLSKVESGRFHIHHELFDLHNVLESLLAVMFQRANERGLELNVDVASDVPLSLIGDADRLKQVLINLVSNSVKFTHEGSVAVRITAPEITASEAVLRVEVADTGIGIPPEKHQAVFAPFTQADSSTTRKYGGTGLGLTICRQLVELMGGTISLASEPGHGSTFTFTVRVGVQQSHVEASNGKPAGSQRVLVVDDKLTNRMVIRKFLLSHVESVQAVDSGVEALSALDRAHREGRPYNLVLVDHEMPGMNGLQLVAAIHERAYENLRLVVLSSSRAADCAGLYRDLGVREYAVKPVRKRDLLQLVLQTAPSDVKPQAPDSTAAPAPRKRILLAEDSNDNVFVIRAFLKDSPYEIDHAADGEIAVEKFKKGLYNVVLMDIQMPLMDGHTAAAAIRAWESENGQTPTPILALTAHALREQVEKSRASGCNAHLTKPIQRATLLTALAEHTSIGKPEPLFVSAPEGLEELAGPYLQKRRSEIPAIHEWMQKGDLGSIRRLAHDVKGTGSAYGFELLTDIARTLEMAASSKDLEAVARSIAEMEQYLGRVELKPVQT